MAGDPPARFVSEALVPSGAMLDGSALSAGEPPVPATFRWGPDELAVREIRRTWRTTNTDRGDAYLARLWYDIVLADGRVAVIYFDRKARAHQPRWWLYTISDSP